MKKQNHSTPTLFICCHSRDDRASCAQKNSEQLAKTLKDWTKKEGLSQKVKIRRSSCQGNCEEGISAFYSKKSEKWLNIDAKTDLESIKATLNADS